MEVRLALWTTKLEPELAFFGDAMVTRKDSGSLGFQGRRSS
jgi:hypothetical protein